MKVNFIILGAQKCATTTLFDILSSHPNLVGCSLKEPHFFSTADDWRKELPEYESLFERQPDAQYFEASTTYTFYPLRNLGIWNDLHEYNPDLKFIYIVRNPINRIVSSYMHSYERGYTDLPIEEALVTDRLYIDVTRYHTQIIPYIEKFGRDRVLLLEFDDLVNDLDTTLSTVSDFIGEDSDLFADYHETRSNVSVGGGKRHVRFDKPARFARKLSQRLPSGVNKLLRPAWDKFTDNSSRSFKHRPKISFRHKKMVLNMLKLEIDALAELMDRDLSHWQNISHGE